MKLNELLQSLMPKKKDTTLPNPFKAGNEAGYNQALDDTSEALDVEIDLSKLSDIIEKGVYRYHTEEGWPDNIAKLLVNSVEKWIRRKE